MNLSAEQYLNLVDQMTVLRIQNQKYQRDNSNLTQQIEKHKNMLQSAAQHQQHAIVPANRYQPRPSPDQKQRNKICRTADDYVQQFKNSMSTMQNNICQFIKTSGTEQMSYIKQQIKHIKQQLNIVANKQEIVKKQPAVLQQNKENIIQALPIQKIKAPIRLAKPTDTNKKAQQFIDKIFSVYCSQNNDKKDPTLEEVFTWVNKAADKAVYQQAKQQYNPIKTVKQARSSKKLLESKEPIRKSVRKQKKNNQESDRNLIDQYIQEYEKNSKNRDANKENYPIKNVQSMDYLPQEDPSDMSLLRPKLKAEEKKKIGVTDKQEKPKLKKKGIMNKKDPMAKSGLLNVIKQQKEQKKGKSESKTNINVSTSKLRQSKKNVNQQTTTNPKPAKRSSLAKKSDKNIKDQLEKQKNKPKGNARSPSSNNLASKKKIQLTQGKKQEKLQERKSVNKNQKKVKQSTQNLPKPEDDKNKQGESKKKKNLEREGSKKSIKPQKQGQPNKKRLESKRNISESKKNISETKKKLLGDKSQSASKLVQSSEKPKRRQSNNFLSQMPRNILQEIEKQSKKKKKGTQN